MTLYAGNSLTGAIYKGDQLICSSSGGGGEGSGTTDVELTRISDDSGNEIGTWYMNFADANNNIFKVIILDARYRNNGSYAWCSNNSTVTGMPLYGNSYNLYWYDNAKETATENTTLILDYCSAKGYTSTACSYCRSQSFSIGGVTYYGQLPNMREVFDMWKNRAQIDTLDTSASSHSSTNFGYGRWIWSSTQFSNIYSWLIKQDGNITNIYKSSTCFTAPVLEIPLS